MGNGDDRNDVCGWDGGCYEQCVFWYPRVALFTSLLSRSIYVYPTVPTHERLMIYLSSST